MPIRPLILGALLAFPMASMADPLDANREMIRRGVQAVLTCNGLFTSGRSLEQVFDQELAYMGPHLGTADGGDYRVHQDLRAVEIGSGTNPPMMRAAFRDGIGCIVLAPGQGLEDIDELPAIDIPPPAQDPATLPWPDGDLVADAPPPARVDAAALQATSASEASQVSRRT